MTKKAKKIKVKKSLWHKNGMKKIVNFNFSKESISMACEQSLPPWHEENSYNLTFPVTVQAEIGSCVYLVYLDFPGTPCLEGPITLEAVSTTINRECLKGQGKDKGFTALTTVYYFDNGKDYGPKHDKNLKFFKCPRKAFEYFIHLTHCAKDKSGAEEKCEKGEECCMK